MHPEAGLSQLQASLGSGEGTGPFSETHLSNFFAFLFLSLSFLKHLSEFSKISFLPGWEKEVLFSSSYNCLSLLFVLKRKNYSRSWPGICLLIFNNQALESQSLFSQAINSALSFKSLWKLAFPPLHLCCNNLLYLECSRGGGVHREKQKIDTWKGRHTAWSCRIFLLWSCISAKKVHFKFSVLSLHPHRKEMQTRSLCPRKTAPGCALGSRHISRAVQEIWALLSPGTAPFLGDFVPPSATH